MTTKKKEDLASQDEKRESDIVQGVPRDNQFLTREEMDDLAKDIVGETMDQMQERAREDRKKYIEDMRDIMQPAPVLTPKTEADVKREFRAILGCLGRNRNDLDASIADAKEMGDETLVRALSTATTSTGGAIVVPQFSTDWIPYLRAQSVHMSSGVTTVDMPSGYLHLGKVSTGATAAYRGEASAGTVDDQVFGEVALSAKIMDVMTPASNQLLSRSPDAGRLVEDDLIGAILEKADSTLIRSDGSANRPKGIRYWAASANVSNETNTAGSSNGSTTAERITDLWSLIKLLMDNKIRFTGPCWEMSTRTFIALNSMLDANSNYIFREDLSAGKLLGYNAKWTQNIPDTLTAAAGSGAGSDASELYFFNAPDVLVGETQAMRVSMSDGAYTESGSLVSAFERGETLIKVELEHDQAVRFGGTEIAILTSVTWA